MTDTSIRVPERAGRMPDLRFVWLEITGRCQLECVHCYAESGPSGTHGAMTVDDWRRVIRECADLGVGMVQFIGGEPTMHLGLPDLIDHALLQGLQVEVFSNLVNVSPLLWITFARKGVRLACSYYSDDPGEHQQITHRNTHARTRANIAEAVARSIPLRVGIIRMSDTQRVTAARRELEALGVTEIGTDRLRQVGRGVRHFEAGPDQLCGKCADGVVAISPSGEVWPCVFSRWMPVGNVVSDSLGDILTGEATRAARAELASHFDRRNVEMPPCNPSCRPMCGPNCQPTCPPNCSPTCAPQKCGPIDCWPRF